MKPVENTPQKILRAANNLFYHQGYNHTSIGDIVKVTGLSKGNITYHFKSKQDILEAVINNRLTDIELLLKSWDAEQTNAMSRLYRFCDMLVNEQQNLSRYGCPLGTLTSELAKNDEHLHAISQTMFETFKNWLTKQFSDLGFQPTQAEFQALKLLSQAQGIAMITHVFGDTVFLKQSVEQLKTSLTKELQQ